MKLTHPWIIEYAELSLRQSENTKLGRLSLACYEKMIHDAEITSAALSSIKKPKKSEKNKTRNWSVLQNNQKILKKIFFVSRKKKIRIKTCEIHNQAVSDGTTYHLQSAPTASNIFLKPSRSKHSDSSAWDLQYPCQEEFTNILKLNKNRYIFIFILKKCDFDSKNAGIPLSVG